MAVGKTENLMLMHYRFGTIIGQTWTRELIVGGWVWRGCVANAQPRLPSLHCILIAPQVHSVCSSAAMVRIQLPCTSPP